MTAIKMVRIHFSTMNGSKKMHDFKYGKDYSIRNFRIEKETLESVYESNIGNLQQNAYGRTAHIGGGDGSIHMSSSSV